MRSLLILITSALIVCACGVKGPPLPPESAPLPSPTPTPTATPAEQ